MKKSYENRTCLEVICSNCGKSCLKPKSELTRNKKLNRLNFCSCSCTTQYRINNSTPTEKELQARKNLIERNKKLVGDLNPSKKRLDQFSIFRETLRKARMHSK